RAEPPGAGDRLVRGRQRRRRPRGKTMSERQDYVLGQSAEAARRLAIQDAHFAEESERLLDELALRPHDRVVELGCGSGSFSRRILSRLGEGGVLVGVDRTEGLLTQARALLAAPPHPYPSPPQGRGVPSSPLAPAGERGRG